MRVPHGAPDTGHEQRRTGDLFGYDDIKHRAEARWRTEVRRRGSAIELVLLEAKVAPDLSDSVGRNGLPQERLFERSQLPAAASGGAMNGPRPRGNPGPFSQPEPGDWGLIFASCSRIAASVGRPGGPQPALVTRGDQRSGAPTPADRATRSTTRSTEDDPGPKSITNQVSSQHKCEPPYGIEP